MKNLIATEGRVLVEITEPKENKTSSGIFLAQKENPDLHYGKVINAGPVKEKTIFIPKEGYIVYWQNYSGVNFTSDGKDMIILNQSDIIAYEEN